MCNVDAVITIPNREGVIRKRQCSEYLFPEIYKKKMSQFFLDELVKRHLMYYIQEGFH